MIVEMLVPLEEAFRLWCKKTKRSGGVLLGSSIREFFEWYHKNYTRLKSEA